MSICTKAQNKLLAPADPSLIARAHALSVAVSLCISLLSLFSPSSLPLSLLRLLLLLLPPCVSLPSLVLHPCFSPTHPPLSPLFCLFHAGIRSVRRDCSGLALCCRHNRYGLQQTMLQRDVDLPRRRVQQVLALAIPLVDVGDGTAALAHDVHGAIGPCVHEEGWCVERDI